MHPNDTCREDIQLAQQHLYPFVRDPAQLPVSFIFGDTEYRGLAGAETRVRLIDSKIMEYDHVLTLGDVEVRAECFLYRDFGAVEWTVFFTNRGTDASPRLRDLLAADTVFHGTKPVLYWSTGEYGEGGFSTSCTDLSVGTELRQQCFGGKSCHEAYPFQRLLYNGYGYNIVTGWPGQWCCSYRGTEHGDVAFRVGQQVVDTILLPGEVFRSPRMTLVGFTGDYARGINVWRRWYFAHCVPYQNGQMLQPMVQCEWTGGGNCFCDATEENQLPAIHRCLENDVPVGLWWLDAGWFPCGEPGSRDWWRTGDWKADPVKYPNGLAPVGELCARNDINFIVWFEPERVHEGSPLFTEHPDWLLRFGPEPKRDALLDLGNRQALDWACRHFSQFLIDNKVTIYRQDYNIHPLAAWRHNEAADRRGMVENKYIQGYLAFWDYLLANVPDLCIDTCASGGLRNDYEAIRRAVPLHPTDNDLSRHPFKLDMHYFLYTWTPYFRGFNLMSDDPETGEYGAPCIQTADPYTLKTSFSPILGLHEAVEQNQDKPAVIRGLSRYAHLYQSLSRYFLAGDLYTLTEPHKDPKRWTVWQFDHPESGDGLLQCIRQSQCQDEDIRVYPHVPGEGDWRFENPETGESFVLTADELRRGMRFTQPRRSVAFWRYAKA